MDFELLKLSDQAGINEYNKLLKENDLLNPYFLPGYFDKFSNKFESLVCFHAVTQDKGIILLPGYIRKINHLIGYYDFTSPYGYSGPLFSKNITEIDLINFWKEVDNWHLENNIISEFIRFSLNNNFIGYSGELNPTLSNIKGVILSESDQWINFDRKVRKNIKRALSEKLVCTITHGYDISNRQIEDFYSIYYHTMNRNQADDSFYYSLDDFKTFITANPEACLICSVYDDNHCISTELALLSKDSVYSFLGGTLEASYSKRPNDFLKYSLINWARSNNKIFYVLGGGYGSDDGIYKFKKSFFSNDVITYFTGRKIINMDIYNQLVSDLFNNEIPDTLFFPLYRYVQ